MTTTFFATKSKLTQAWDKNSQRLPITVLQAQPLTITQVKTRAKDGYNALQVAIGTSSSKPNRPSASHLKKSKLKHQPQHLREIRLPENADLSSLTPSTTLTLDQVFQVGDQISATSISKGRGFSGVIKRWGFAGGPRTHGQSDRERAPGSIGQGTTPGRVWKGKKMPGRYGNQQFTIKNLTITALDPSSHQIWVKGTMPGATGSLVQITKTGTTKFPGLSFDPFASPSQPDSLTRIEPKSSAIPISSDKPTSSTQTKSPSKPK